MFSEFAVFFEFRTTGRESCGNSARVCQIVILSSIGTEKRAKTRLTHNIVVNIDTYVRVIFSVSEIGIVTPNYYYIQCVA